MIQVHDTINRLMKNHQQISFFFQFQIKTLYFIYIIEKHKP